MHANVLKSSSFKLLSGFAFTKSLTLHGNPCEEMTGYRQYVMALMPNLLSLDFTKITQKERVDGSYIIARLGGKFMRGK
jgi:hypothetical protein